MFFILFVLFSIYFILNFTAKLNYIHLKLYLCINHTSILLPIGTVVDNIAFNLLARFRNLIF